MAMTELSNNYTGSSLESACVKMAPYILNTHKSSKQVVVFFNNHLVKSLTDLSCLKSYSIIELEQITNGKKIHGGLKLDTINELANMTKDSRVVFVLNESVKQEPITIYRLFSDKMLPDHSNKVGFYIPTKTSITIRERLIFDTESTSCSNNFWIIDKGSSLTKYRLLESSFFKETSHDSKESFYQGENSLCNSFSFFLGNNDKSSRGVLNNKIFSELIGKSCNSNHRSISFLRGSACVKNKIKTIHHNIDCNSHEIYKGVFDHDSQGEFDSLVVVERGAINANTVQKNNNVLLSSQAKIDSNPQLEIFTDDVKCSHGSTTGQLDADAIFYLRSRGLSLNQAMGVLLKGFLTEVVEFLEDEEVCKEIENSLKNLIKV